MPKNQVKTTEEAPDDPQVNNRKVATCVRLYEEDLEKFQNIPELQGTMSRHIRESTHHFLSTNGYSNAYQMNRLNDINRQIRELESEKFAVGSSLAERLALEYRGGEEIIEKEQIGIFLSKRIEQEAKINYIRYQNALIYSADATLKPTLAWTKGVMNQFKTEPTFDMTPNEMLNKIMEITENKQKEWDEELEQKQGKYTSR